MKAIAAMKAGDKESRNAISLMQSAIKNRDIEARTGAGWRSRHDDVAGHQSDRSSGTIRIDSGDDRHALVVGVQAEPVRDDVEERHFGDDRTLVCTHGWRRLGPRAPARISGTDQP